MADANYLYTFNGDQNAKILKQLPSGASVVVTKTLQETLIITTDTTNKDDLDEAMASRGWDYDQTITSLPDSPVMHWGNWTADPTGIAPAQGDLYHNTTSNNLREYNGSTWGNV